MYSNLDLIKDIWNYVRPYKSKFWVATIVRAISDLAWLYPPYAIAEIINFFNDYQSGMSLRPIYTIFALGVASMIIKYAGAFWAKYWGFQVGERVALDATMKVMRHLFLLDIVWHEKENTGNKFKKVDRGSNSLYRIIQYWIINLIEIVINFVGVTIIILKFDKWIAWAILFFIISFYILSRIFTRKAIQAANVVNDKEEVLSGLLFESINNIRSIKVMSMAAKVLEILEKTSGELFSTIKNRIFWFQHSHTIRNVYGQVFRLGAIVFIVYGIIQGKYEVGFLVLFIGYFATIWQSISELSDISQDFTIARFAIARMQNILQEPITIDGEKGKVPFPTDWKKLLIENVSFSYGDKPILDNVSLEIKRGEKIGIVGLSGAGKSTLFKLLLKEYESYRGEITFDRIALKEINRKDYFNHLAVVLQETELFNASLRDNITITNHKQEKNEELLEKALTTARVRDFVYKLPQGIDSIVGEKGIRLSGGEKQRVGIARAVFKDPQIFLLDEATSHLDIESEEKIKDSLHQFFQNVTAIVIAHRLTTIKEMDKIVVLENGRVVECGSFAALYKKKGRFFELWEKQKL